MPGTTTPMPTHLPACLALSEELEVEILAGKDGVEVLFFELG